MQARLCARHRVALSPPLLRNYVDRFNYLASGCGVYLWAVRVVVGKTCAPTAIGQAVATQASDVQCIGFRQDPAVPRMEAGTPANVAHAAQRKFPVAPGDLADHRQRRADL